MSLIEKHGSAKLINIHHDLRLGIMKLNTLKCLLPAYLKNKCYENLKRYLASLMHWKEKLKCIEHSSAFMPYIISTILPYHIQDVEKFISALETFSASPNEADKKSRERIFFLEVNHITQQLFSSDQNESPTKKSNLFTLNDCLKLTSYTDFYFNIFSQEEIESKLQKITSFLGKVHGVFYTIPPEMFDDTLRCAYCIKDDILKKLIPCSMDANTGMDFYDYENFRPCVHLVEYQTIDVKLDQPSEKTAEPIYLDSEGLEEMVTDDSDLAMGLLNLSNLDHETISKDLLESESRFWEGGNKEVGISAEEAISDSLGKKQVILANAIKNRNATTDQFPKLHDSWKASTFFPFPALDFDDISSHLERYCNSHKISKNTISNYTCISLFPISPTLQIDMQRDGILAKTIRKHETYLKKLNQVFYESVSPGNVETELVPCEYSAHSKIKKIREAVKNDPDLSKLFNKFSEITVNKSLKDNRDLMAKASRHNLKEKINKLRDEITKILNFRKHFVDTPVLGITLPRNAHILYRSNKALIKFSETFDELYHCQDLDEQQGVSMMYNHIKLSCRSVLIEVDHVAELSEKAKVFVLGPIMKSDEGKINNRPGALFHAVIEGSNVQCDKKMKVKDMFDLKYNGEKDYPNSFGDLFSIIEPKGGPECFKKMTENTEIDVRLRWVTYIYVVQYILSRVMAHNILFPDKMISVIDTADPSFLRDNGQDEKVLMREAIYLRGIKQAPVLAIRNSFTSYGFYKSYDIVKLLAVLHDQ